MKITIINNELRLVQDVTAPLDIGNAVERLKLRQKIEVNFQLVKVKQYQYKKF